MSENPKVEATIAVTRLAFELTMALARAQEVGVDIVISYDEIMMRGRTLKHVVAHIQSLDATEGDR